MATELHEGAPGNSLDQIPTEILGEIFKIYMSLPRPAELDNLSEHSRDSFIMPSPYVLSESVVDFLTDELSLAEYRETNTRNLSLIGQCWRYFSISRDRFDYLEHPRPRP